MDLGKATRSLWRVQPHSGQQAGAQQPHLSAATGVGLFRLGELLEKHVLTALVWLDFSLALWRITGASLNTPRRALGGHKTILIQGPSRTKFSNSMNMVGCCCANSPHLGSHCGSVQDLWRFMAATYWAVETVLMVCAVEFCSRPCPIQAESPETGLATLLEDHHDGGVCKISGMQLPFCYSRS